MRTNFVPDRVYSTPASIEAFCLAVADRRKWLRGEADDMHLEEPRTGDVTSVRKAYRPRASASAYDRAYEDGFAEGHRAGFAAATRALAAEDTEPR